MFLMLNVRVHLYFKLPVWDRTGNKRAREPAALESGSPAAPNCHVTPLQLIHTLLFEKRAFENLHTAVITGEMTGLFLPQPHLPLPVPAISTQSAKCHETETEISNWHPIHWWNDGRKEGASEMLSSEAEWTSCSPALLDSHHSRWQLTFRDSTGTDYSFICLSQDIMH